MAISEDTAALVAAQLTAAWATRMGTWAPNPRNRPDEEILAQYLKFRGVVRETIIPRTVDED